MVKSSVYSPQRIFSEDIHTFITYKLVGMLCTVIMNLVARLSIKNAITAALVFFIRWCIVVGMYGHCHMSIVITLHLGQTNPLMFSTTPRIGKLTLRQKFTSFLTSCNDTSCTTHKHMVISTNIFETFRLSCYSLKSESMHCIYFPSLVGPDVPSIHIHSIVYIYYSIACGRSYRYAEPEKALYYLLT